MNSKISFSDRTIFFNNKAFRKWFLAALSTLLIAVMLVFAVFGTSIPDHRLLPRMVDEAGLLSISEVNNLTEKLDEISERLQFDVAVVTTKSIGTKSMQEYADDFYDYNGYGIGQDADGIMLVVLIDADKSKRECYITATGYGEKVLTDRVLDRMLDDVVSYLKYGEYAKAFDTFAELSDSYVQNTREESGFDPVWILFSAIVGIIVSFIIVSCMKGKLKSVRKASSADNYIREDSLNVTESRELFLYSNISKTVIETESSSGGGNSTSHTSSSGRSHSGGGRSF